jgi:hypothetical protein
MYSDILKYKKPFGPRVALLVRGRLGRHHKPPPVPSPAPQQPSRRRSSTPKVRRGARTAAAGIPLSLSLSLSLSRCGALGRTARGAWRQWPVARFRPEYGQIRCPTARIRHLHACTRPLVEWRRRRRWPHASAGRSWHGAAMMHWSLVWRPCPGAASATAGVGR